MAEGHSAARAERSLSRASYEMHGVAGHLSDAAPAAAPMERVDSGHETLVSDDSPCDLATPPPRRGGSVVSARHTAPPQHETQRPPRITPFSGVLSKGKVVIRPIAFKPAVTPPSRFSNAGERYGSTPILTRPGSQLTLYGSNNDLRHHHYRGGNANYSLDRKLLSSCTSTPSSPPLAMSSLTSLPLSASHKMAAYHDSMESVRKSPLSPYHSPGSHSTHSHANSTKSFHLMSGGESRCPLDLTPSPSDSGVTEVSELESALRDRDAELAYLRQTMEHNEQVIFRVYQEKERVWDRELRRMKSAHENRLRAAGQKALKLEQMLMMQTYQLQQDKKLLREEADRACREAGELRQEVDLLRGRLEETEWGLCQKTGELSHIKTQLKDAQADQTSKSHDMAQLRGQLRDVLASADHHEAEATRHKREVDERDREVTRMRAEMQRLIAEKEEVGAATLHVRQRQEAELAQLRSEIQQLDKELVDVVSGCKLKIEGSHADIGLLRDEVSRLSKELEASKAGHPNKRWAGEWAAQEEEAEVTRLSAELAQVSEGKQWLEAEVQRIGREAGAERGDFERERVIWAQEKEKVLRYQRQLQLNYVQMFRRTRTLEAEVENMTLEMELDSKASRTLKKQLPAIEMGQTIEL